MTDAIRVTRTTQKKQKPKDKDLAFGTDFTDHMFLADFQEEKGWYDPRIEPYGPLTLDPATAVLHYGQGLFEGLKAFRGKDGKIRLFRPDKHAARINRTAEKLCIPALDADMVMQSWTTLVDVDRDWVPSAVGTSLYIRPTVIASEPFLGVRPAKAYLYYVILSPVGAYYPEGMAPVKIKVIDDYVRAVVGGLGEAKTMANYAASLHAAEDAKHEGFTQVLWLDGVHRKYIEEVGTMNIMMKIGDEIITPPLAGTIPSTKSSTPRTAERSRKSGAPVRPPSSPPSASSPTRASASSSPAVASGRSPRSSTTPSSASSTARRPIPTAGPSSSEMARRCRWAAEWGASPAGGRRLQRCQERASHAPDRKRRGRP
jgi:branched-chain amino acid aminotransferase group II